MPLDINAFRSIANQNPDKLVYVHGQSLKTTRNQERHGAHTYRAATNAFLKACTDHYGSRMGEAIVKFLLADIEGGKPLTARKIKALVEFADEKMGSADKLSTGVKEIGLSEIGKDKMLRVGFRQSTKLAKADAGQKSAAAATLGAFKFDANGKVDIEAVLRHLNTLTAKPRPAASPSCGRWRRSATPARRTRPLPRLPSSSSPRPRSRARSCSRSISSRRSTRWTTTSFPPSTRA